MTGDLKERVSLVVENDHNGGESHATTMSGATGGGDSWMDAGLLKKTIGGLRYKWAIGVLATTAVLYVSMLISETNSVGNAGNSNLKKRYWFIRGGPDCSGLCAARPSLWNNVNPSTGKGLGQALEKAHHTFFDDIQDRYGEYTFKMFMDEHGKSRARYLFRSAAEAERKKKNKKKSKDEEDDLDLSVERLRNKFMEKLLEIQIALIKQEGADVNSCDCNNKESLRRSTRRNMKDNQSEENNDNDDDSDSESSDSTDASDSESSDSESSDSTDGSDSESSDSTDVSDSESSDSTDVSDSEISDSTDASDSESSDSTDASDSESSESDDDSDYESEEEREYESVEEMPQYTKLVWTTGGHSSAAGHGNLFSESYAAEIGRLGQRYFGPLGVAFEGRNFAMGGTSSGPAVAMCFKEIFGTDVDIIGWDYGMTDGNDIFKLLMYGARASMQIPTRPVLVALGANFPGAPEDGMIKLEKDGLGALNLDQELWRAIYKATPDMEGMEQADIDAVPAPIRYFQCDGRAPEDNEPCNDFKYSEEGICEKNHHRAPWHPGWKYHSLLGHVIFMFFFEIMVEAAYEIETRMEMGDEPEQILASLHFLNQHDQRRMRESTPNTDWIVPDDEDLDIDRAIFYKAPLYCHTAVLPSVSRFQGILTERPDKVGNTDDMFDAGIALNILSEIAPDKPSDKKHPKPWPLVYDSDDREQCGKTLWKDFKDYFYVREEDGWVALTLPNDAELEAYRAFDADNEKRAGLIVICENRCDWDQCPPGTAQLKEWANNTLSITIDGQPVTKVSPMDQCFLLQGRKGSKWGPGIANPNKKGQYEIKVRVNEKDFFWKVGSIIVL